MLGIQFVLALEMFIYYYFVAPYSINSIAVLLCIVLLWILFFLCVRRFYCVFIYMNLTYMLHLMLSTRGLCLFIWRAVAVVVVIVVDRQNQTGSICCET